MECVEIRRQFVEYYQNFGFQQLQCASLLHPSLPKTFVMSAGRTQIDDKIAAGTYRKGDRYVLLQPCFRHFDLGKIGDSPFHLSLFEMGGAYCFGTPSRLELLERIWHFLTDKLGIPPQKLWTTYFSGDELDGLQVPSDSETVEALEQIGVSPLQMVGLGAEENLLKEGLGDSTEKRWRKIGPMVEFFFDLGEQWRCGAQCRAGCQCGRFIEVSNTLFIYWLFDETTKTITEFQTPFAETVIGIERLATALQEGESVFDIPSNALLISLINSYKPKESSFDLVHKLNSERIIADHIRALVFLVADGAPPPGQGGRQWIIKKLIRGVLTHQKLLEIEQKDFVQKLIETTICNYTYYPNIKKTKPVLEDYIDKESTRFEKTLVHGNNRLNKIIKNGNIQSIGEQHLMDLVKRYGFPLPLLKISLIKMGIEFNLDTFS